MRIMHSGSGRQLGLKLIAAVGLVALADYFFWQQQQVGSSWGVLALALAIVAVLVRPAVWRRKGAWIAGALALLYGAALADNPSILALLLFAIALTVTILLPATARFGDGWQWVQRLAFQGVHLPATVISDLLQWSRVRRRSTTKRVKATALLAQLTLPVLGSAIFLMLFSTANPVLETWLQRLHLPAFDPQLLTRALLWLAIFHLVWLQLRPRPLRAVIGTFEGRGDLTTPGFSPSALRLSLIAFNAVFALQNMMDLAYLGGLAVLPEGMTLADYAHRGAYPLIATALLAGLFTLIALRPGSSSARDPLTRRLLMAWIAQNVLLVAMSAERTLDYVRAYSLTEWRIAALAWMALVAIGLVLTAWRMLADKSSSWLINSNLVAALAVLTPFTLIDMGGVAAQWNVRHAKEVGGQGASLDLCYLGSIGASALLPLVELEQRTDLTPAFRQRVQVVRHTVQARVAADQNDDFWTARNARRLAEAERLIGKATIKGALSGYACDGAPMPPPAPLR